MGSIKKRVDILPCDACNFKTGNSTCWYFGKLSFVGVCKKVLQGCCKYRSWWTTSTVRNKA
jgi:hypothetical protein